MIVDERGPDDELVVVPGDENLGREIGRVLRVMAEFCEASRDDATPESAYAVRRRTYDALTEMGYEHYTLASFIDRAMLMWRRTNPAMADAMREMTA